MKKVEAPIDMDFLTGMQIAWASGPDSDAGDKKRPGPRTAIDDGTLVGHAMELNWLLGSVWPDIGWQLQHLRKPDDVRAAFEPLREQGHRGLLNPFLRPTGEKATGVEVHNTRKVLGEALTRYSEAEKRHRVLLEGSQLAEAALRQAPPDQREVVELEAKKRGAELEEAKKALDEANKEVESLEKKLRDQEAYYAQAELFNFIHAKTYACNPRNLAFAMTGLPYISCRWSAWRCQRQKPDLVRDALPCQVFEFIRRTWERRESTKEQSILELFQTAVLGLPKTEYLRTYLAKNWRNLKQAIRDGVKEGRVPTVSYRRVPYIIASNFFKNLSQQTTVDRLLAEKERLNLA